MNIGNGRLTDVVVERQEIFSDLVVWADDGNKELLESIEGVSWVSQCSFNTCKYEVHLDPRYSIDWIEQEIIARIKIGE